MEHCGIVGTGQPSTIRLTPPVCVARGEHKHRIIAILPIVGYRTSDTMISVGNRKYCFAPRNGQFQIAKDRDCSGAGM
jgi:hypothetical protein